LNEDLAHLNKDIANAKGELARRAAETKRANELKAELELIAAAQEQYDVMYKQFGQGYEAIEDLVN
jgi:hypothetical protein